METFARKVKRRSPLLLAALLAQTAGATIPEGSASHAVAAAAPARAPTLVRLEPDAFASADALTAAMNACVDAIVARDFAKASPSCDRAVQIARTEGGVSGSSVVNLINRRSGRYELAAAVSNRAVLKWMMADASYAQDLERAKALGSQLDFVQANLAAIGSEAESRGLGGGALAQATRLSSLPSQSPAGGSDDSLQRVDWNQPSRKASLIQSTRAGDPAAALSASNATTSKRAGSVR